MSDINHLAAPPHRAVRLVFEYTGQDARLVGEFPLDDWVVKPEASEESRPEYFVETRDADGNVLARVAANNAFRTTVEVFPERSGDPIEQVPVEVAGAFTVIAPVTDDTTTVAIMERPVASAAREGSATDEYHHDAGTTEVAAFQLGAAR